MSQSDIIGRLYAALASYEDVSPEQGGHPTFEDTIQTIATIIAPVVQPNPQGIMHRGANVFAALRRANADRMKLWCDGREMPDLTYLGLELAGEAGEVANAVKKLERERHGWPGSRVTVADVAAELGDVVICADHVASKLGLQLDRCVIDKFNQTSVDRGFEVFIGDYVEKQPLEVKFSVDATVAEGLRAIRERLVDRLKRDPIMKEALRSLHDDRLRPMEENCADAKHEEVAREGRVPRKEERRPNILVFINGDPRSGKDTVSAMMAEHLEARGWKAEAVSSIEPVRAMLTMAGIDVTAKTEADRFLLSEVGDRVEEHSNFRSDFCVETYLVGERAARQEDKPYALILHTREPETIHKIAFKLRHENVETHTLFVAGRGTPISSNKADSKVRNMDYDMEVLNDASLEDLRGRVTAIVNTLTS